MIKNIEKVDVLFSAWRALGGEVRPNMRAAVVHYGHYFIMLNCYFDGLLSEDDIEAVSCIETEVLSDFPTSMEIIVKYIRLDAPMPIEDNGTWIYAR